MAQSEFGPGRLDQSWLTGAPGDPWVLETCDPNAQGHRDAFLGNGWMGQRISVEGDAGLYPVDRPGDPMTPGGCLIHGLWDEIGLMTPPLWAVLDYHDGECLFRRGSGTWTSYRQRLDLRTAALTTDVDWDSGSRQTRIMTRVFLSRTRPNVGVVEREITPAFDGTVRFIDRLDGSFIRNARDWRVGAGDEDRDILSLEVRMGPRERRLAIVSRLQIDGPAAHIILASEGRLASRTLEIPVRAGQAVRVTKFVALVTDAEAPNPLLAAWNLAEGAARDPEKLWTDHKSAWSGLWASRIEVENPHLQQILNSSLYQLYCHVREDGGWSPGPTGLSANSWVGHVFWDSDLWMFPGLCLLHPDLGRGFVEYRHRTLPGAQRNALAEGWAGAMFAWESAEFGDETIPHLFYHNQHHVNSDVALAQWWYALISGNEGFLREKGVPIILESARFWASRVVLNAMEDRYEIRGVCCADEWAKVQDNNAYTNYSAAWNLRLAVRLARRFGLECPEEWETIAGKLWVPFDQERQLYLEYEGYAGQTVKQADTALLVYPYEMPMSDERKANIVDYYRERYPRGNIMMAAAFDGIVDCELGRPESAWESLRKLLPHFREPFLLASESPLNECISFATGLGGLLQLLLMGFAGIRIREEGILVHPCVPEEVGDMAIYGLHYGGVRFDLSIHQQQATAANASGPVSFLSRSRVTDPDAADRGLTKWGRSTEPRRG